MGYRCEHFIIQELVPQELYKLREDRCWEMLDIALLRGLDLMRKRYGVMTINNWHAGGTFNESGLRSFITQTGAVYSMHKLGKAADAKFKESTPIEIAADMGANAADFPMITCMENPDITRTWLHVDTRNHGMKQQIWIVNP